MAKRILIYGASGGIGSATARLLRKEGCALHLAARRAEPLAALAGELGASFTAGDVEAPALFERVAEEGGDVLDGLVYAVGTIRLRSLARLEEQDFLQDFRVNALGAALAVRAALPALKRAQGEASVVLFSSVAASQGFGMHASIGMAKGAVNGLGLALAAELAPKVRVNVVAPSLSRTPLAAGLLASERTAAAIAELHALQRLGEASDSAAAAAFLLSPKASWITGQVLGVDGGRSSLRTRS